MLKYQVYFKSSVLVEIIYRKLVGFFILYIFYGVQLLGQGDTEFLTYSHTERLQDENMSSVSPYASIGD